MNPILKDLPDKIETERLSIEITKPGDGDEINQAVRSAGVALPYITARLTCGSGSDKMAVVFLFDPVRFGGTPGTDTWIAGLPAYSTDYVV